MSILEEDIQGCQGEVGVSFICEGVLHKYSGRKSAVIKFVRHPGDTAFLDRGSWTSHCRRTRATHFGHTKPTAKNQLLESLTELPCAPRPWGSCSSHVFPISLPLVHVAGFKTARRLPALD